MSYETLLQSVEGQVATITLNRPKVLNAMNKVMFHEMDEAFAALAGDAAVRVVLLRGAGGKPTRRPANWLRSGRSESCAGLRRWASR